MPMNTYGPVKKVAPKEVNYLIGYTDLDGNDYIGIRPDFDNEPWFQDMMNQEGLENLCKEYPYQPMKVNKDTGMMESIGQCEYNARVTNCFHVIYHMRLDEIRKRQFPQTPVYQTPIVPATPNQHGFTMPNATPSVSINPSNYIMNSGNDSNQIPSHSLNLESAYHREPEVKTYHETGMAEHLVENQQDINAKHTLRNVDGNMLPEGGWEAVNKIQWHPNMAPVQNPMMQPNYYNPAAVSGYNPYAYNPAYGGGIGMTSSYLPQYRSNNISQNNAAPTFDCFQDVAQRRMERDQANVAMASQIKQEAQRTNPTMLETGPTIDFSNPDSIAQMQMPSYYTNPMYNNMGNPNITMPQPQMNPYGLNNPYGNFNNPGYNYGYNPYNQYGYGYNNYGGMGFIDLDFMIPSQEEIDAGKGVKVSLIRTTGEAPETIANPKTTPKYDRSNNEIKVSLVRVHVIEKDGKEIELTDEEYDKYMNGGNEEPANRESIVKEKFQSLNFSVKGVKRWYSEEYEKKVNDLANQITVYDEARALCLVGSLEDLNKEDYKIYFQSCVDKLQWYKIQEQTHPDKNYRVPYRYRKLPMRMQDPNTGKIMYSSYKIPNKRWFNMEGETIPFYDFDRGREPNDDEWTTFYNAAEFERDLEVEMGKAEAMVKYAKEQEELDKYNPYDPVQVRMHEYKVAQKMQQNQYDIFRQAYGSAITDEQFDSWWYCNSPKANSNPTSEDMLETKIAWRRKMTEDHINRLSMIVPIDQDAVRNDFLAKAGNAVREFDQGYMEGCNNLQDFFDRLGYLNVRVSEDNIDKQRQQVVDNSINKYSYNKSLYRLANENNTPYSTAEQMPGVDFGKIDPAYGLPSNYVDFTKCEDYAEKKRKFDQYCMTSQGTIPLKPIYK